MHESQKKQATKVIKTLKIPFNMKNVETIYGDMVEFSAQKPALRYTFDEEGSYILGEKGIVVHFNL